MTTHDDNQADSRMAELLQAKGFAASPAPEAAPEDAYGLAGQAKIVVRRERKGRGGKTVTLVTGLALPPAKLDALSRALRKGLGCGSTLEGSVIVLQGDIVPRVQEWLSRHGAKKIVLGN